MMFRQKISQQSRYQKDSFRTLSDTKGRENGCYGCQYPGVWTISGLGLDSNSVVGIGMA